LFFFFTANTLLVAWFSGNTFHPIRKVILRRSWLVVGWVTAGGQVDHLGM